MDYTLIRSDRKTLAVEIGRGGEITVRAPRFCPQCEIDRFISSRADWIESHSEKAAAFAESHPEPTEAERKALIRAAKTVLPEKTAHYADIMRLCPAALTITGAKTRFGSCSSTNRISYSWRLMQYPDAAQDYVVVHELSHIVHKNHGKEFYALIESVLPDWRERRRLLKNLS